MIFLYRLIHSQVGVIEGLQEAPSKEVLLREFKGSHAAILSIKRKWRSWTAAEKIRFWEGLLQLVESGYRIHESLDLLAVGLSSKNLRLFVQGLYQRIEGGSSFSSVCFQYPKFFSPLEVQLISVCEKTGDYTSVIRSIVEQLRAIKKQKERIFSALSYPLLILFVMAIVFAFYELYLFPEMGNLIQDTSKAEALRQRESMLTLFSGGKILVVSGLIGVGLCFSIVRETILDRMCKIKVIASFFAPHELKHWFQAMRLMMAHNVHMLSAMQIASSLLTRARLKRIFKEVEIQVAEGKPLSLAFESSLNYVPKVWISQLIIAEKTGSYHAAFAFLAQLTDKLVKQRQDLCLGLLGPTSIGVVGILMVCMLLRCLGPLYETIQGVQ